jgi:hypothetical protein
MTIGVFIALLVAALLLSLGLALLIGPAIRWGTHPPVVVYDQEQDT